MIFFFFFNDTATTEIYTLSLHDALPISRGLRLVGDDRHHRRHLGGGGGPLPQRGHDGGARGLEGAGRGGREEGPRSEEHTSELQSRQYLVCRLLLEKKK